MREVGNAGRVKRTQGGCLGLLWGEEQIGCAECGEVKGRWQSKSEVKRSADQMADY